MEEEEGVGDLYGGIVGYHQEQNRDVLLCHIRFLQHATRGEFSHWSSEGTPDDLPIAFGHHPLSLASSP